MEQAWFSCHLYYADPLEIFLKDAVAPFISKLQQEQHISQYFYIRYWINGPHIRLRMKANPEIFANRIKPLLERYFTEYFITKPSVREEPEDAKSWPENLRLFPNNSLGYAPYRQEPERYGGHQALQAAEKHFEVSSSTVLSILKDSEDWSHEKALGKSIQLHLSFAHAVGMDMQETRDFYTWMSHNWFPRAYHYFDEVSEEEKERRKLITRKAFDDSYEQDKDRFKAFHRNFWDSLTGDTTYDQDWLNYWIRETRTFQTALKGLQEQRSITPPTGACESNTQPSPEKLQLWEIYDGLLHMTSNRLVGVRNWDEAYITFVIKESL